MDDKNDEQNNQRSRCPKNGQDRIDLILTEGQRFHSAHQTTPRFGIPMPAQTGEAPSKFPVRNERELPERRLGARAPSEGWACPSLRGGATLGTVTSWIIHPSYHPLWLFITNNEEMSVKTSLKARGSFGSVGRPGLSSPTTRTHRPVGNPQFASVMLNSTVDTTANATHRRAR